MSQRRVQATQATLPLMDSVRCLFSAALASAPPLFPSCIASENKVEVFVTHIDAVRQCKFRVPVSLATLLWLSMSRIRGCIEFCVQKHHSTAHDDCTVPNNASSMSRRADFKTYRQVLGKSTVDRYLENCIAAFPILCDAVEVKFTIRTGKQPHSRPCSRKQPIDQ